MLCLRGRGAPSAGECVYCGVNVWEWKLKIMRWKVRMSLEAHHNSSRTDVGWYYNSMPFVPKYVIKTYYSTFFFCWFLFGVNIFNWVNMKTSCVCHITFWGKIFDYLSLCNILQSKQIINIFIKQHFCFLIVFKKRYYNVFLDLIPWQYHPCLVM